MNFLDIYWQVALFCVVGYLLGSLPFATLIAKRRGIDISKEGSGNPGATNVRRVLGKGAGVTVFILDFLKGFLAVLMAQIILMLVTVINYKDFEIMAILAHLAAILGHNFSVFMRFRGGKGVSVTLGGLIILSPAVALIGVAVWLITFFSLRYVSLASLLFGLSLPLSSYFLLGSHQMFWFCLVVAALLIVRHQSNIVRLIKGTENRFVKTKTSPDLDE